MTVPKVINVPSVQDDETDEEYEARLNSLGITGDDYANSFYAKYPPTKGVNAYILISANEWPVFDDTETITKFASILKELK